MKVETEADLEVSDNDWHSKQEEDGDNMTAAEHGCENEAAGANGDRHVTTTKSQGLSEYKKNKAKNANLRKRLAEVEKNYPLPKELRVTKGHRKPASSKKSKALQGDVVCRESTRIKDLAKYSGARKKCAPMDGLITKLKGVGSTEGRISFECHCRCYLL